jgi:hypothetical protein
MKGLFFQFFLSALLLKKKHESSRRENTPKIAKNATKSSKKQKN